MKLQVPFIKQFFALAIAIGAFGGVSVAQAQSGNTLDQMAAENEFRHFADQPGTLVRSMYPNPARNSVNIALAEPAMNRVDVVVYTYNATVMRTFSFAPGGSLLGFDVSSLPVGQYIIQVRETGKSVQSLRLVRNE